MKETEPYLLRVLIPYKSVSLVGEIVKFNEKYKK